MEFTVLLVSRHPDVHDIILSCSRYTHRAALGAERIHAVAYYGDDSDFYPLVNGIVLGSSILMMMMLMGLFERTIRAYIVTLLWLGLCTVLTFLLGTTIRHTLWLAGMILVLVLLRSQFNRYRYPLTKATIIVTGSLMTLFLFGYARLWSERAATAIFRRVRDLYPLSQQRALWEAFGPVIWEPQYIAFLKQRQMNWTIWRITRSLSQIRKGPSGGRNMKA
ncbi:uncharacterized conserved protein [Paenibacillus popilliae ATCC 14706]|uniref:Uncharacterized conserved protein n=2 Tax=Paenibacillus popilliae TaxID=78057 RepID=M9LLG2_PAEPP|nr:uncharacterized conserved protein [Paenibacillus popilliae ATCC 14706]